MRIVHYLNQFFRGLGGEEKAGTALDVHDAAVGPGKLLEQIVGPDARVVLTLICGDNYAIENQETLIASALEKIRAAKVDLLVAGPCFLAGRYGMAAGALCAAAQAQLGIPAITAMARENPGADLYREALYIVDSGGNAAKMRDVLTVMARVGLKLMRKEPIGFPGKEGYIPRGLIRDQFVEKTAGERLVDMALAKVKGERFESEMPPTAFQPVPAPTTGNLAGGTPPASCAWMSCARSSAKGASASCAMNLSPLPAWPILYRTPAVWGARWRRKPNVWASTLSFSPPREEPARAAALRSRPNWKRPASRRCRSLRRCPSRKWSGPIGSCSATALCKWWAMSAFRPRKRKKCAGD